MQTSGYYLAKVLDLQEHLLVDHFLKYNLRFHWRVDGTSNNAASRIIACPSSGSGSNIPTFQLDRNKLEAHLLK